LSEKAVRVTEKMLKKADEDVFKALVSTLANNLSDADVHSKWHTSLVQIVLNEAIYRKLELWFEILAKSVDPHAPKLARRWIERLHPNDSKRYDIWKARFKEI
jgi:hypothetical protein